MKHDQIMSSFIRFIDYQDSAMITPALYDFWTRRCGVKHSRGTMELILELQDGEAFVFLIDQLRSKLFRSIEAAQRNSEHSDNKPQKDYAFNIHKVKIEMLKILNTEYLRIVEAQRRKFENEFKIKQEEAEMRFERLLKKE